jgi:hypothetical protein
MGAVLLPGKQVRYASILKRQRAHHITLNLPQLDEPESSGHHRRRVSVGRAALASYLGIDLSNEHDTIARAIRIGIADFDPTRVLKNCQRLFVTPGSHANGGRVAQTSDVGTKFLYCTLHWFGIGGVSLDRTLQKVRRWTAAPRGLELFARVAARGE